MRIPYQLVPGPSRPSRREQMLRHTGQRLYPAIELGDGTWYREESKEMEQAIRGGSLTERARGPGS